MAADRNGRAANGGGAPATNGRAYPIEDHSYDVVVVGAGGAGPKDVDAELDDLIGPRFDYEADRDL